MSTDGVGFPPSRDYSENCLLNNLPPVPTKHQIDTLDGAQGIWFILAAVVPFIILVLIGGWGGMFQSGDASAYIVGAIVVCFAESIFQLREENFSTLKKYWSGRSTYWGPLYTVGLGVFTGIVCFVWNIYFAIHDRHVGTPSVDWVQILVFCISLIYLPGIRFTATAYAGEAEWNDPLRKRISYLHSKAMRSARDAEKYQLDGQFWKSHSKMDTARSLFEDIDDFWCASQARNRADELLKRWDPLSGVFGVLFRLAAEIIQRRKRYRSRH
jgi:hypothetical protein